MVKLFSQGDNMPALNIRKINKEIAPGITASEASHYNDTDDILKAIRQLRLFVIISSISSFIVIGSICALIIF